MHNNQPTDILNSLQISDLRWKKIEKTLEELLQQSITWINDDEICKLLNIPQRALEKYISSGKIPPTCYKTSGIGIRIFNKNKLLGL